MKRIFALLQYIMRPAIAICLACLLVGPLLAAESAGEMKLQKARVALTDEPKDPVQAKKLLLDIVEHDKDTLDSQSLCYVYVYLGYIEDRAGNRNEAIPWYQKALKIKDADRVQECATFGLEKPLTWIRHLDENATPPPRQQNSPAEAKLQQARDALHGEPKNADLAKKLLLEILENDKNTLDSPSLCYVYVYLGYIEDRAGNRNEAVAWYKKAIELKATDRVRECAEYGFEKPLTWIRHLDEATTLPPGTTAGKISLATAPPVVVRTFPLAGATNVDPALTEIRATYSKPMQDGSWSWSIWNEENYPETIGKPHYLPDGCTCVLPVNLKPDKFYAIWLNNDKSKNFTDTNGKPAVPYLLTFRTGTSTGAGEQHLKALVENFFAHNYRDITARDTIEWGQASTDDKGNSSIRYKYRAKIWDKDTVTNNQVFVFDAQDKFVSVKDAKPGDLIPGNPAEDYGQTVAGLPPVVVETHPVSGARDVEPGVTEIRVRFSKEMADGSWSWSTAWENSAPEIIGQPHYESDGRTCVAKVKLEPGRTYAWWLNSDKFKNFTDLAGRPAVPYLLIFQTKPN
jgi:tetratricopeptide (TPR) repeat protein